MQRDVPFRGKRAFQELCRPYWMHAARANLVLPPISTEAAPSSRPVHDSAVPPPSRDSLPSRNDDDECMTNDDDLPHMPNARTRLLKRAISLLKKRTLRTSGEDSISI